jgi:putative nucleotidyltransferase with HDIG domain
VISRHLKDPYYHSRVTAIIALVDVLMPLRDPYSNGHEKRVAKIAVAIAMKLGLAANFVDNLEYGAHLHDIGKLMIAENVLNKPKLTISERNMVKSHAALGVKAIHALEFDDNIEIAIKHHHENWDGSGYPDGLDGEAIPLGARIIRVADTFDAMTSDRPYRETYTQRNALIEMEKEIGTSFDPMIFRMFQGMMG